MAEPFILSAFFLIVLLGTIACGYPLFVRGEAQLAGKPAEGVVGLVKSLGERMPAQNSEASLRRRLVAAGYRSPNSVALFNGVSYLASGALALLAGVTALIAGRDPGAVLVLAACAAGFVYVLANRVLDRKVCSRSRRLVQALPTALDLLVLGLEAGQSIDQSLWDASKELRRPFPDLADEFAAMHNSLRASASRSEVFRAFAGRHSEPEIGRFTSVLIDADRFGTALGPALRSHARYLRVRRRQAAQESARKVGVKLVFPIFFLIFPSILLVTLGPAVIQIMNTLGPMMQP
ncbi:MAG: type II secretion system F family protein [Acidobacteria bacterium]|nr:type II secretion system F family protein [Acidobacteriota bacterium]